MYSVTFKCPGGGHFTIDGIQAGDGHWARRIAICQAIARGYSRQCGQWSGRVTRTW